MAGLKDSDRSPHADAVLLAALFLPFLPIVLLIYAGTFTSILDCPATLAVPCVAGGIDFNRLYARAAEFLLWSTQLSASGPLLAYLALLGVLAQLTTWGFRGRIVRTFAVIMWAGVVPLMLGLANAIVSMPNSFCGGQACTLETIVPTVVYLGRAISEWFATNAVPLATLATLLVAMTMGYRWLIARTVRFLSGKPGADKTAGALRR